jgi:hypothetical protein
VSPSPSQPTCAHCGAPLTDQAWICHACTGRLVADIGSTPDLLNELDITITRQARITAPAKGNGDKPLPYDIGASIAAGNLHTALHGWARTLHEETSTPYPAGNTAVPAWLARHVDVIRIQEWAAEMAHDIKTAVDKGWCSVDRPEERYYAGPCGNQVNDPAGYYVCSTVLWTRLQASTVRCRTCKATYDAHERRTWLLDAAQDVEEAASVIASALTVMLRRRVTASTIRTWAQRGLLEPVGERGTAKLYRVGDVRTALERADAEPQMVEHAA